MKSFSMVTLSLLIGGAMGFWGKGWIAQSLPEGRIHSAHTSASSSEKQPLYWVAPMDPNYRRDKPGKSPMGMDLVPVYEEANGQSVTGTVRIDSAVANNLGVKTAIVKQAPLSVNIDAVGYVTFDESQLWQVNLRVSGWIERLRVDSIGEAVKKGDVLFTLYSPELVKAQEELLLAQQTRREPLIRAATARLSTLGMGKTQIQTLLQRKSPLTRIEIKAPSDGVIATLNVREGGYLTPSQTALTGAALDPVWVDVEVFERQAAWLQLGTQAKMMLEAMPDQVWEGAIDYIYPVLDPFMRTLKVRLIFPNPDGALKPNMFANVRLASSDSSSFLVIPRSAVIRVDGMTRVVLSEGDGKFRSARIEVGRESGQQISVLQGLKAGDRVVTSAQFLLDSESSRTAELSRINGIEAKSDRVWAKGEIIDVMADHRMLTIFHQPVPEWRWPSMTMNFTLAQNVDMRPWVVGKNIRFEMQKTSAGGYEIVDIQLDTSTPKKEAWLTGNITLLMADFGMITLTHAPVDAWQWQAGEMNFSVDGSVPLAGFEEGQAVRFLVAKQGTEHVLKRLEIMEVQK